MEKRIKKIKKKKVIKQAHYRNVDTGQKQRIIVIDENGQEKHEDKEIKQKVFIPAIEENIEEEITIWVIKDGEEEHEFLSKDAALAFKDGRWQHKSK